MAYTTINKSTDYFNTKIYNSTGNDNLAITGVGFEADLTWIKKAKVVSGSNTNEAHMWADQVRGGNYYLNSSSNAANASSSVDLKSWQSDGFTLGTNNRVNQGSTPHTYASWNWKANGQGSSNTDGSINTIYTSVNTTAGFSIIRYDGNGTSGATIGHGLGSTPAMIIVKNLDSTEHWTVRHKDVTAGWNLYLNLTNTQDNNSTVFTTTAPTSSVFSVGDNARTNASGSAYIAYCFAEKQGYSKIGSYIGSSSTNGAFIYTGFKPTFFMAKCIDNAESWYIFDNKREGYNPENRDLYADTEASEGSTDWLDLVSNGIKFRYNSIGLNASSNNYIYMAIGQSLVGSNNVPCTAR